MERDNREISVRRQCDLLSVNRSGLYCRPLGESEVNVRGMKLIDGGCTRHPFKATRRMVLWRAEQVHLVNRKRVSRLMEVMGIEAIYPKSKSSWPAGERKILPCLLRGVEVTRVNQVWRTDITCIPLAGGFLYLVAVMDWFSGFVLSWALSLTMKLGFCLEALRRALRRGWPEIFNSDQGSQFTSEKFTGVLESHGIAVSMDGPGRCLDNIFIEPLWRSLRNENVYLQNSPPVSDTHAGVGNSFRFYNQERPHQSLG